MFKLIIGAIIGAALFASVAKAEDKAPTVTPKQLVDSVVAVPGKVHNHLQNEWVEIKAFQAKSWADAKAQNQANWEKLKGLFNSTKSTN